MWVVAFEREILELEVVDVFHRRIEFHLRQRTRFARELQFRLFEMIRVKVQVAERVNEIARFQIANLRDHPREQRVAGDVEGHAEKQIRTALVKLAAQFTVLHKKLKQRVARRQRHLLDFADVPRADDEPARIGIFFDLRDDVVNLVDAASVGGAPVAPLRAIDAAKIAVPVRPFVPDRHLVFLQIADVGVAAQKPEQFVNDGAQMQFLRGENGEIFAQIKPRLRAENGISARARAVGLEFSVVKDVAQQIEILSHCRKKLIMNGTKDTKKKIMQSQGANSIR